VSGVYNIGAPKELLDGRIQLKIAAFSATKGIHRKSNPIAQVLGMKENPKLQLSFNPGYEFTGASTLVPQEAFFHITGAF